MHVAILSPRYRVVNFRVSSEEYESVYVVCVKEGYRTISEFARNAVLKYIRERRSNDPAVSDQLAGITSKLDEVISSVSDLKKQSASLLPAKTCSGDEKMD